MSGTMFMRVSEVAEELGVSESYAYKLIQKLNKELKATGCLTLPGRIDRKFFHDHICHTCYCSASWRRCGDLPYRIR